VLKSSSLETFQPWYKPTTKMALCSFLLIFVAALLVGPKSIADTKCNAAPDLPITSVFYSAESGKPRIVVLPATSGQPTKKLWAEIKIHYFNSSEVTTRILDPISVTDGNSALIWDTVNLKDFPVKYIQIMSYAGNDCGSRGKTYESNRNSVSTLFPYELELVYEDSKAKPLPIRSYNTIEQGRIQSLPIPINLYFLDVNYSLVADISTPENCKSESKSDYFNYLQIYPLGIGECKLIVSMLNKSESEFSTELVIDFQKQMPRWTFQYGHYTLKVTVGSTLSFVGLYYPNYGYIKTESVIASLDKRVCTISADPLFKKRLNEVGVFVKFLKVGICSLAYSHQETPIYLGDSGVLKLKVTKGPIVRYKGFDNTYCQRLTRSLMELVVISKQKIEGRLSSCPEGFEPAKL